MVVDDHPVFRMGLVALLSSIDGLEVVAQADSVASAIAGAEGNEIDVVMMDLNLGDESGVEATREIVARKPGRRRARRHHGRRRRHGVRRHARRCAAATC